MALSRKARTWLLLLGIPLLMAFVLIAGLKLYFTDERLQALIIPRIEETLQRKVAVRKIELAIFPSIGVDVHGLTIANKPGFSEQPLFSTDRLLLKVKLFELLKKRVEITTLTLEKPVLNLEVSESGSTNYAMDKTETSSAPPPDSATATGLAGGAAILLSDFRLVDGQLSFLDRQTNSATRIQRFSGVMRLEVPPESGDIRINSNSIIDSLSYGSLEQDLISDMQITANLVLLYQQQTDRLTVEQGSATVNSLPLTVNGSVETVVNAPFANLQLASDTLGIEKLLNLTPRAYAEKIEGVSGQGTAKAHIVVQGLYSDSTFPEIRGRIETSNASLQYPRIPKPITDIRLVADFTRGTKMQQFNLTTCTARLGTNPISLVMTVVSFHDPALTMTITGAMNLAEVKDYYPLEPGTDLGGSVRANVRIAGKINKPDAMQATGSMEFKDVVAKTVNSRNPVQRLNGTISFNNQIVESKNLSMIIGRSDLSLAFSMKNYLSMVSTSKKAARPSATLALTSSRMYTADIMSDAPPSSTAVASGQAPSGESQAPSVSGPAPAKKTGLPLPNVDLVITASVGTLTIERFEMKNVKGVLRISNGLITMQNFSTNMFDGNISSTGIVDLQDPQRPTFDLKLDMNSLQASPMLSSFTSFGRQLHGSLNMDAAIRGAMDDTLGLIPSSLNATGKVAVANGRLTGLQVNKDVASLLKLPDLEEVDFKDWGNSFTIKDGRVNISGLKIMALGSDYSVEGSHGLDGTLDLKMSMLLSEASSAKVSVPGFAGEAIVALKEPDGRLRLDFFVGGTAGNPTVRLDTEPLQARAAEFVKKKLDAETQKLQDGAKKKVEELMKGLFKKK